MWTRGYGLVDGPKVQSAPGKVVNLTATVAPTAAAAAEYYPGSTGTRCCSIPAEERFPGHRADRQRHPAGDEIAACLDRHDQDHLPDLPRARQRRRAHDLRPSSAPSRIPKDAWIRRVQSGQAMTNMALTLERMGPDKGLELFADWTDRIKAGEMPFASRSGRKASSATW